MNLLIAIYLLALTGYVIYIRFKAVPSVRREADEKIRYTSDEMNASVSKLMEAVQSCGNAIADNGGIIAEILSGTERNYQRVSQIQRQLEENALAGAASKDAFNEGLKNIWNFDPYDAIRKGRETMTE